MHIIEKTTYHVNGECFDSQEKAQEYCEELLAGALCSLFEQCDIMAPKAKLKLLEVIHRLSVEDRRRFADMFIVSTESEE